MVSTTSEYEIALRELLELSGPQLDEARKAMAKRFNCRLATIDADLLRQRRQQVQEDAAPYALVPPDADVWDEPVDGSTLLDSIMKEVQRYVVLTPQQAATVALWAVYSWAFDTFSTAPRLALTSAEKRSGKTTLLSCIGALVPRAMRTSNTTPAALFRTVDLVQPTVLIDEADTFLNKNKELVGLLNSGHRREFAYVIRLVKGIPVRFQTWAPVAIAGIGALRDTLQDRSIMINLRRRKSTETVNELRLDQISELRDLARQAKRWTTDHLEHFVGASPQLPASLADRVADNWRPLLVVAELAGKDWAKRAREAATQLSSEAEDTVEDLLSMLLHDIQLAFSSSKKNKLSSDELTSYLNNIEEHPWAEWKGRKGLSKNALAALLRPLGVRPHNVRIGSKTPKGYETSDFDDAFDRYLIQGRTESQAA